MDVALIEPFFPANQRQFARALAEVGARVTGIGEAPGSALGDELRGWLFHYEQVDSVCNEDAVRRVVGWLLGRAPIERLEAVVEAHIMPTARVREAYAIPGTSVRTAYLCRDKPAMKEALRAAGVPCAQSTGASSEAEVRAFVEKVGYPIIIKPRDAAGASGTLRVDGPDDLSKALRDSGAHSGLRLAVEEFVEGHEGFYDTLTIDGEVVHDFASHYYPNVLESMRTRWISPHILCTNRIDSAPGYAEVRAMGKKVIEALGIGTSATHMEWFMGPKGLKFSEIGCRPPGVLTWDLYNVANDMDMYREWAMAIVHGRPSQKASRRFSTAMIALRPDRDGRIVRVEGADEVLRQLGDAVIDSHIPPPGTRTQPVEAGYMANAWVRLRHPDYDRLRDMLDFIGQNVKVRAA